MENNNKIRVADFIMQRLHDKYGVKFISLITGNGALVLNDALCKIKDKITPICVHHEADAGYFALGYSKYTNKLSVVTPTTGCAGTNCMTPLLDAYQDHVPILFLSGNVALKQTSRWVKKEQGVKIKKLGPQELDIIEIVKHLTKYSVMIEDSKMVQYELDKAISIALTPSFGPVWVDLPADIGASLIEEKELLKYETSEPLAGDNLYLEKECKKLKEDLQNYKRLLILAGNGIILSNSRKQFKQFIEKYNIPCVVTYGGVDLLDYNHPLYLGGPIGVKSCRASNFILQQADLILVLGCCLNTPQVGYMGEKFAPNAKKIVVDIDIENHRKDTIKIDKIIECELSEFFRYMNF